MGMMKIESNGFVEEIEESRVPSELVKRCCFNASTLHPGGIFSRPEYSLISFFERTPNGARNHVATVFADTSEQLLKICELI